MTLEIPEWLVKKFGRSRAHRYFRVMVDRYRLLSFNSNNEHPLQVDLLNAVLNRGTKINFFIGGNRIGKSEVGAVIATCIATGIKPWCVGGTGLEDMFETIPIRNVWIVSLDFPASRDIIRPKLKKYLPKDLVKEWRQADQMYVLKNGATIGMKSADSGREKFQGVSRDLIWMDEEPPEEIFDECMARTIDCAGKLVCTMTPLNGMSWSHERVWLQKDKDPEIHVVHGTMLDNPYLPRKEVERVKKQWTDKAIRDARIGGLYTLLRGAHVFNPERILELQEDRIDPVRRDHHMGLSVWEEPQPDVEYVVGADIGKGKTKGDFSAGVVLDAHDRNVVAVLRARVDAETFGHRLAELGRLYNNALVNVERQDHGIVAISVLQRLCYPRLYRRRAPGRLASKIQDDIGWSTDMVGKSVLISTLQTAIEEKSVTIPDKVILDELASYIWYEDKIPTEKDRHKVVGKCGAMAGKHDDTVIAFALALVGLPALGRTKRVPQSNFSLHQRQLYQRFRERRRGGPGLQVERKIFVMGNER